MWPLLIALSPGILGDRIALVLLRKQASLTGAQVVAAIAGIITFNWLLSIGGYPGKLEDILVKFAVIQCGVAAALRATYTVVVTRIHSDQ